MSVHQEVTFRCDFCDNTAMNVVDATGMAVTVGRPSGWRVVSLVGFDSDLVMLVCDLHEPKVLMNDVMERLAEKQFARVVLPAPVPVSAPPVAEPAPAVPGIQPG